MAPTTTTAEFGDDDDDDGGDTGDTGGEESKDCGCVGAPSALGGVSALMIGLALVGLRRQ